MHAAAACSRRAPAPRWLLRSYSLQLRTEWRTRVACLPGHPLQLGPKAGGETDAAVVAVPDGQSASIAALLQAPAAAAAAPRGAVSVDHVSLSLGGHAFDVALAASTVYHAPGMDLVVEADLASGGCVRCSTGQLLHTCCCRTSVSFVPNRRPSVLWWFCIQCDFLRLFRYLF
eukprot:SAG22_NODE_2878_length_2132_cov_0.997049_3_plen_173_part_00